MASTNIAFDIIAHDRASAKFDKVGKSASGASSKLKSFAKVGAVAAAGAAVVAGKAMFDMAKAAIEDEKSQAILARQLKNSTGATKAQVAQNEDYISSMGRLLGVADDDLRPAIGRLAVATGDLRKAQSLSMIAMNVSAGTGKSLKSVTEALAKAQKGNVSGLARLGIATKNAAGETKSLDAITADLANTYAGAASTAANTTEGKFARLKLQFDEMKETIGSKLIPVASSLADFLLTKVGPAAGKVGDWFNKHLKPAFEAVGKFIKDKFIPAAREVGEKVLKGLKGFIDNVSKSLKDNRPFIEAVGKALAKVGEFVVTKVIPALASLASKTLPVLGTAIGKGIDIAKKLTIAFTYLGEYGVKSFRYLLSAALGTFSAIVNAAAKAMGWIPGLGDKIKSAAKTFDEFKDRTVAALKRTEDTLHSVRDAITGIPKSKTVNINVVTTSTGAKLTTDPAHGIGVKASGGPVKRGRTYLVGEEGPELFTPDGSGAIIPAAQTARRIAAARSTGGGSGDVKIYIQGALDPVAVGRQVEQALAKVKRLNGGRDLAFQ